MRNGGLIRQNGNGREMEPTELALRRTFWCVLQGLERDGQRTRAGILADVNDSRRDNVEPFQHRRIRLLDCFARYGESSFILRRLDPAKENREQGVKLTRHTRLIASAGRAGPLYWVFRGGPDLKCKEREGTRSLHLNVNIHDSIFFLDVDPGKE